MNSELLVGGVTLLIWIGIFLYLVRLDKKVRDLQR
jgi:CcmD family protein